MNVSVACQPKLSDIVYGSCSGVFFCFGVFINALTIVVIIRSRRLQSTTNYFLISLSILGISSSVAMIFIIVNTIWKCLDIPPIVCKIIPTFTEMIMCNNQLVLVSISLDRYFTLTQNLSFKITKFQARKMILVSFGISVIVSAPFLYLLDTKTNANEKTFSCAINVTKIRTYKAIWIYLSFEVFVNYLLPFAIISVAYFKICVFTWTFGRQGVGAKFFQRTSNHILRSKIKILKILIFISVIDLVSMLVISIFKLLQFLFADEDWNTISLLTNILFYTTAMKPVVYLTLNSNFRRGFKEVLCWSKRHYYRTQAYSVTTITAIAKRNYISNYDVEEIGDFRKKPKSLNFFEFPTEIESKMNKLEKEFNESYRNNYFDNVIYLDNDLNILKKPGSSLSSLDRSNLIKY